MEYLIPETSLITVGKEPFENATRFTIEPLSPGFGITFGNSLRRILLSSLPGAAITTIKIDGITHEFTHINGMREDVVELILNLKKISVKSFSEDPVTLTLDVKGPKKITTDDISKNPSIEFASGQYIAQLSEKAKFKAEITIEQGRGYVSSDLKKEQKLPLGTIAMDAIYSPIVKVNFSAENTRLGRITNFDKLVLDIETNGTISGEEALSTALKIYSEHITKIADADVLKKVEKPVTKKKSVKKSKKEKIKETVDTKIEE